MAAVNKLTFYSAQALTAASNVTSQQNTEVRFADFLGVLIVSACNGATTVATLIEHSPDGSNWFTLCAFTNVVGTTGKEVIKPTVPVLPFVRGSVTLSGVTKAATVSLELFYSSSR
jgi:hypothetical protein